MKFVDARVRGTCFGILLAVVLVVLSGCNGNEHRTGPQYVYVAAEHAFLRSRVAPVAKFVAEVINGERLRVLDHQTRFYKVKAPDGKVGWIEELYVITQAEKDKFDAMRKKYAHKPVVAKAVLDEASYLHDAPGVQSPHYYLLPSGDRLDLLERASVTRAISTYRMLKRQREKKEGKTLPPLPMDDYWLARDAKGRTGWVRGSALLPDVPNSVLVLANQEQMIGGYLLEKVKDPGAKTPDHMVGEYVAVYAPYKAGLPYNFNEVRVFTWYAPEHVYQTAFVVRHIQGFFPVKVGREKFPPNGEVDPVFSFRISRKPGIHLNPKTGRVDPGKTEKVKFRMIGVVARQIEGPKHFSVLPKGGKQVARRHAHSPRK